jgi:signal transduction histidine kinase
MLRTLRLRLSLLYLAAALGLVVLMGAGTYSFLALYFQHSTDLALEYKMALEFRQRSLPLPASLSSAELAWQQDYPLKGLLPLLFRLGRDTDESEYPTGAATPAAYADESEGRYDGSLAPVFLLGEEGTGLGGTPAVNDPAAISEALGTGSDLRTVVLSDGMRVRLLTFRLDNSSVLQVGRLLGDQDRLLSQYLTGLFILGSIASLFLALSSWWLAGRSIKPAIRAWDQQQQFISNASHELRAPLTILRANADYALRSGSNREKEQALREIVGEVDYMNRMVEDLLLLSRLDARRLSLTLERLAVDTLLAETVRTVEKVAVQKEVSIQLQASTGSVKVDPARLRQVLLVLLDNALRYTPAGGTIWVGAQIQDRQVAISVADNGSGIPDKDLPYVFERFYQVSGQGSEGHGNGLGLSIAKGLVEAQHGTISIASQPGKGTTVTIYLPEA